MGQRFIPAVEARRRQWLGLAIAFLLLTALLFSTLPRTMAQTQAAISLPAAKVHPLPPALAQWNETQNAQGDYFDQVKPTAPGFLLWSHAPITVFIAPLPTGTLLKPEDWQTAITQAVQEWQPYLPLALVDQPNAADIRIEATAPQRRSGERVRSAETRFELYLKGDHLKSNDLKSNHVHPDTPPTLAHRMTIIIRPSQTLTYLKAAARHELGHALGLWGHSQRSTDVMYFAQVRHPPPISARDINTLKRLYQQPTQLGWPVLTP